MAEACRSEVPLQSRVEQHQAFWCAAEQFRRRLRPPLMFGDERTPIATLRDVKRTKKGRKVARMDNLLACSIEESPTGYAFLQRSSSANRLSAHNRVKRVERLSYRRIGC